MTRETFADRLERRRRDVINGAAVVRVATIRAHALKTGAPAVFLWECLADGVISTADMAAVCAPVGRA